MKIKKSIIVNNYFYKIMLILFIFMALLTAVLCQTTYVVSAKIVKQKIIQELNNTDQMVSNNISNAIDGAQSLMQTIAGYDILYTPYEDMGLENIVYLSKDFFRKFILDNYIDSIYIYYKNCPKIITSDQGILDLDYLENQEWLTQYKEIYPIGWGMHHFVPQHFTKNDGQEEVVSLMTGFPLTIAQEYGVIVLNLNLDRLTESVCGSLSESQELLILDRNDQLVYGDLKTYDWVIAQELQDNTAHMASWENREMMLASQKDPLSKWRYILVDDTQSYLQELAFLRQTTLLILFVTELLVLCYAVFSSRVLYRPIKKMVGKISKSLGSEFTEKTGEFDAISNAVNDLVVANESLEEFRLKSYHSILQGLLIDCCYHDLTQENTQFILGLLEQGGYDIANASYFGIVIQVEKYLSDERTPNLKTINEYIPGYAKILFTHLDEERLVGLVVVNQNEFDMYELISAIQETLEHGFDMKTGIGVGNLYQSLDKFSVSFNEALDALSYSANNSAGVITHINLYVSYMRAGEKNESGGQKYYYSMAKENELLSAIKNLEEEKALKIYDEICFHIQKELKEHEQISDTLWLVMSGVFREISTMGVEYQELSGMTLFEDYCHYNKLEDTEQKCKYIRERIRIVVRKMAAQRNFYYTTVSEKLSQYIENHLDSDLSLTALGEVVELNPVYVSEIFKQANGTGLREYIRGLRMEKAKEHLSTTKWTIDAIARTVGYENTRSFLRAFKNETGITPTEYRKKHKD